MAERLIVRLAIDYLVRWARRMADHHEGDLLQALVYATAFQTATDHLDGTAAPGRSDAISIYALALALGQSRETVRRKVKRLAATGWLEETPGGVRASAAELETARGRRLAADIAQLTRELLGGLAGLGMPVSGAAAPGAPRDARARLVRASNACALRLIELMARNTEGEVIRPVLFAAITVANTRHLPQEPDSPFARFIEPLPDSERRPVTALALSREMGLPRETTRRYLAKIESRGGCRRVAGGYITNEAYFFTPQAQAMSAQIQANARRLAATLPISVLALAEM